MADSVGDSELNPEDVEVRPVWPLNDLPVPVPVNQLAIASAAPNRDGVPDGLLITLGYVSTPHPSPTDMQKRPEFLEAPIRPVGHFLISAAQMRTMRDMFDEAVQELEAWETGK
jgi:hypothetical protein